MQQGTKSPRTSPTFIPPELRKNVDDEANRLDRDLKARGINTIPYTEGQSTHTQANQQPMWQNTVPYVQAPQPQLDATMPPGFDARAAVDSLRPQPQAGSVEQLRYQQQLEHSYQMQSGVAYDQRYGVQPNVAAGQYFPVPPSIWNGYDLPPEHKIDLNSDSELDQLAQSGWNQEMQVRPTHERYAGIEAIPTYHDAQPAEHQQYVEEAHAAFVKQPTPEIKIPRTIADFLNLGEWVVFSREDELRRRQVESNSL